MFQITPKIKGLIETPKGELSVYFQKKRKAIVGSYPLKCPLCNEAGPCDALTRSVLEVGDVVCSHHFCMDCIGKICINPNPCCPDCKCVYPQKFIDTYVL